MYFRYLAGEIAVAFRDTPVIFLNGARQTGKTTLARQIRLAGKPLRYLTLDDDSVLAAAKNSASGFIAGLAGPVVLDEVQRAPDLFLAIKAAVDRKRRPGRFLLTGSTDVLLLPRVADSLAGRMEIFTLWPLSQGELSGRRDSFVDAVFKNTAPERPRGLLTEKALIDRVTRGGYPVAQRRKTEHRRRAWFDAYLTTIMQRDVRDLANVDDLTVLPRLLTLLASRAASLLNFADLSRAMSIPQTTLKRYFVLLEITFLATLANPWSANLGKRLVKAPKVYLNDTGLMISLLGLSGAQLTANRMLLGPLLENFVVMELRKQAGWSKSRPRVLHFRTHTGEEVDAVLETPAGEVVGIEVKSAGSVSASDFKGLRTLAELAGTRFRRGIVLYTGAEVVPFAKNLHAVPIQALWQ
ncbi:MAG: ATP-binding protein [Candidatus Solibacter usitatus]|nr:ATP-binding protein [Candidatus Solibacter usitatus]